MSVAQILEESKTFSLPELESLESSIGDCYGTRRLQRRALGSGGAFEWNTRGAVQTFVKQLRDETPAANAKAGADD